MKLKSFLFLFLLLIFLVGCTEKVEIPDRESVIPDDMIKMSPELDKAPPRLYSDEYSEPVPLPYPVNTRGAEDSAFIMPDGNTLYVWFTPNNRMDVIEQSQDLVTGIYKFVRNGDDWFGPERLWFVKPGEPHLDGCGFFWDDKALICGVRKGHEGIHWLKSEFKDGKWSMAEISDFDASYEVGELHIFSDELYFHSNREGGKGGMDIWMAKNVNGEWQEPVNLDKVNSEFNDGWPAVNPAGDELWISKNYGLWRSKRVNGEWQEPEEMIGVLAGEATIDAENNVYFTHHYYENDKMIEADIYVAYRL